MRRALYWLSLLAIAFSGLFTLLGSLANYGFLFDIVSHFRVQYALGAGISLLIVGMLKHKWLSLISAIVLIVNLWFIVPLYFPKSTTPVATSAASLKVLSINVLSSNTDVEAVRREINKFQPDVLTLQEIIPRWFAALADLSTDYPYQVHKVREDNFGIWLLSKRPVTDEEIIPWGPAQLPTATFRYPVGEQQVRVIAMHPMSPSNPEGYGVQWRNEELREIATRYQHTDAPLLVIGDLNTTSFSPIFGEFARQLDLEDSRRGFGLQGSWPAWAVAPLMVTLDHCLVSRGTQVVHREVGDYVGSDHLPVYVEVIPPQ